MENANLMAAVYMGKVQPKKNISLDRIKKSFGQVTEHIISLTSKVQQSEILKLDRSSTLRHLRH